ncbi:universal stress protein [Parvibaculum sp.]|uniref:universal stress protein n=1 Tax=Parvibaculum sp. TaxID=2024848 RepID=UPI001D69B97C|nr:universal stress protein [Parvibaculum sp.]MBX3489958.1 universal stress protein [Parvibaculum sp.]MCW5726054.1 universal stress protein [Parvibaculum sp.]
MIRKLLFATDFSSRSDIALTRAVELAGRFGAALTLLHVVDDDQPPAEVAALTNLAEERLQSALESLPGAVRAAAEAQIVRGDPFAAIADVANGRNVDLIVLGAHRRRILRDIFTGTTAERVIRIAARPVLMVPAPAAGAHKSAVIGVDFSQASRHAVKTARALGLLDGPRIALVHGYRDIVGTQMQYVGLEARAIAEQVSTDVSKLSGRIAGDMPASLLGKEPDAVAVVDADPCAAIAAQVGAASADLVIIGSRGLNALERVLLGSAADAVLRNIECDILVVPPAG